MDDAMKKFRVALVAVAAALLAIVSASIVLPSAAKAQGGPNGSQEFKTAGPISLNNNEGILIGLLLPAVQRRVALPYRLELFDASGKMLVEIPITPEQSRKASFFDVFYGDGSVRVMDRKSTTGKPLYEGRSDGILIGLLLPAVQRNGESIGAIAGSFQLMNANQQRGQIIQMCDGSVRLP